jgi:uncharacterized coiled-coil protein SlyX
MHVKPPKAAKGASDWKEVSEAATRTVDALESRAQELRRLCNRTVAGRDAAKAKQALREAREADGDLVAGAREVLQRLETHISAKPADAGIGAAIGKAAVMALEAFEAAQMALVRKIADVEAAAASSSSGGGRSRRGGGKGHRAAAGADEDDDATEASTLVSRGGSGGQQHQQQETFQVDVYDDIMRERSREVAEIAENIRHIHEIFEHISVMVAEQGEQVDQIETQVDHAADDVTRGRIELERAKQHQEANRNLRCYVFMLIFIMAALFLVGVLYK